jgi:uncharacterized phage protein (predicted DNA packaging)
MINSAHSQRFATVKETKKFLRIDHNQEDDIIDHFIVVASEMAIVFLGEEVCNQKKIGNIIKRIVIAHVGMMYDGDLPGAIPYVIRNSYMSLKQPRIC